MKSVTGADQSSAKKKKSIINGLYVNNPGNPTEASRDQLRKLLFVVKSVRSGDFSNHRGRQALARAAVVDACYASAEKGSEVAL